MLSINLQKVRKQTNKFRCDLAPLIMTGPFFYPEKSLGFLKTGFRIDHVIKTLHDICENGRRNMIKLVSVKCPDCGAALQFEEGRQTAFCSYCGAKILLHNENEYIYRNIDEAEIKQAENERVYMMKELELEEKEDKHHRILTFIWLFITIALFAIGFYMVSTDPTKDGDGVGWAMIVFGMLIGEFGIIFLVERKKKRGKNCKRPGFAKFPDQATNYSNLHFSAVRDALRASGFSNIRIINQGDLRLGLFTKNGSVDSITIDGEPISPDEWYRLTDPIIISYHGFPDN